MNAVVSLVQNYLREIEVKLSSKRLNACSLSPLFGDRKCRPCQLPKKHYFNICMQVLL